MMAAARALLRGGDVFVGDGGEVGQWAQAGISRGGARVERVINGPSGAIGGAIPFAIGARFARAGARVLAVSGDGSIGWHLPELHTAVRHGLPLVVLVGNDGCWNAEVQIQRGLGGAPLDCLSLGDLRYDRAAEALGALGLRVDDPADLAPTLERAFASGRPALIDVAIRNEPAPTYTAGH
jgi:acetolactate synthase-1/2/3 large subunit